ncbi:MAG: folate family ECF transporter S component [Longicatena sp.]|uniref:folate family ECF transporter S component n=1 Tax=Anaerorhabdus sp. TaxID=1872524 RepID=UPI002FCBCE60
MFKKSVANLNNVRYLAIMAIFIVIKVDMASLFIPVGENLRISFTFLVIAVESCIIGPIPALASGFITDIIGFMLFPFGAFFPGYILSAMLNCFIYAVFLYDTRITIAKLFASKFIVTYFCNVLLGSLWSSMLYSKGFMFYVTASFIKNTILFPIEVILLVIVFKLILPLLQKKNLVPKQDSNKIPLI